MIRIFIFLLAVSCSQAISKEYGDLMVTKVISIYDGDTFRANLAGVHPLIGQNVSIRVSGVDTPEIRGKCHKEKQLARLAKQATVGFLRSAKVIELKNISRGKYFRIVADVYADNKKLSDFLLDSNLAVHYHGKKKVNWCK